MSDSKESLGKKYGGQKFAAIITPEDLAEQRAEQAKFDGPDAVGIDAYFAIKGIRNPVMKAGMLAYTTLRRAPIADWDALFANY